MSVYKLLIQKCSDSSYWYANCVGQTVPYLYSDPLGGAFYWSLEPAGYKNIVMKDDAILVEETPAKTFHKPSEIYIDGSTKFYNPSSE